MITTRCSSDTTSSRAPRRLVLPEEAPPETRDRAAPVDRRGELLDDLARAEIVEA
jgi:hypothetical protein